MPLGPYEDVAECVSDAAAKEEFPDDEERLAACTRIVGAQKKEAPPKEEPADPAKEAGRKIMIYDASYQAFTKGDKRFIKLFALDDNIINENKWGVTKRAINENLATIIGVPLLGPPEAGHGPDEPRAAALFEKQHEVGRFTEFGMNGTAWGIAEFTGSDRQWTEVSAGKWKYVSPKVMVGDSNIRHTSKGDVLKQFSFRHVAFVGSPAFPSKDARVLGLCEAPDVGSCSFAAAVERLYLNEHKACSCQANMPDDGIQNSAPGDGLGIDTSGRKTVSVAQYEQIKSELTSSTESHNKLAKEFEDFKNIQLDKALTEKATAVASLKIKAGLEAEDQTEEIIKTLKAFSPEVLDALLIDYTKIADMREQPPENPGIARSASLRVVAGKGKERVSEVWLLARTSKGLGA